MIFSLKKNKIFKNFNRGMTYAELIVVLAIFATIMSVSLFDYGKFQNKVDIKVLANDMALSLVEAQKDSIGGRWTPLASIGWKPSYGVYFDIASNNSFLYFADLNNNSYYTATNCSGGGECLQQYALTQGNTISSIALTGTSCPLTLDNVNILFKRPNTGAIITSSPPIGCTISSVTINLASPKGLTSSITVYPSGRIQID